MISDGTRMKARWVALLIILLFLLGNTTPVSAHSELLRSVPASNASLDRSPAQVELYFSEAVEPNFSSIIVYDSSGHRMDNQDAHVDPADATHLLVSLRSLPEGIYLVSWKVLSAVDSHPTNGSFPFAVGNVSPASLAGVQSSSGETSVSVGAVASKGVIYLAIALLAGGLLFTRLVWGPVVGNNLPDHQGFPSGYTRLFTRLMVIGLCLLVLSSLLSLLFTAGQATGAGFAAPWSAPAVDTALGTRFGVLMLTRILLAVTLAGLVLPPATRWNRAVALLFSFFLLLTLSLESHSAASPQPFLPVAMDTLHLAAASVWVGGLFLFLGGLLIARRVGPSPRTQLTALLLPRFSNLALTSVGLLGLTGLYSALLSVGSLAALTSTPYGIALLVKLLLALPMLVLGAVNLLDLTPRLRRASLAPAGDSALVHRFRRRVAIEAALGAMLILWVGLFTSLPPARVISAPAQIDLQAQQGDLSIAVQIAPGHPGINDFTVSLASNGEPVADASAVLLRFTPNFGNIPPSEATLVGNGHGAYTTRGAYLALADRWQVQVVVRRPGQFDVFKNFDADLTGAPGAGFPWQSLAAILLGLMAPVGAMALLANLGRRKRVFTWGVLIVIVFSGLAVLAFTRPVSADRAEPVNPVPPGSSSILAGEALYRQNCGACHGTSGRGDGPVGLTLNPRPADLSLHAVPGVHTDGQLFLWISNGFPGSVMPGFAQKLTETERWDLVNYLRTLAAK